MHPRTIVSKYPQPALSGAAMPTLLTPLAGSLSHRRLLLRGGLCVPYTFASPFYHRNHSKMITARQSEKSGDLHKR